MSKAIAVVGSVKRYIVTFLSLVVVAGIFAGADAEETYYTAKYQFPVGIPVGWGGFVLGAGINRDNGDFIGLDVNFSTSGLDYWGNEGSKFYQYEKGAPYEVMDGAVLLGIGLSLGKVYQFSDDIQFAYGGSAGYWYSNEFTNNGRGKVDKKEDASYTDVATHSFLAPFVKARWRFLELSYKMFFGVATATVHTPNIEGKGKSKFDLAHHELSVGVYLAKPKSGE